MLTFKLCAFAFQKLRIIDEIDQKIAPWHRAERDAIEFERSENQGQFFMIQVFNYFKVFKCF